MQSKNGGWGAFNQDNDHELFNDPTLEVARLAAGETQDVIIPVEIGTRRFKLSLRLRLDDVD